MTDKEIIQTAKPICCICGEEMYETVAAGQRWWVCNSCGNWEEYE